MQFVIRTHANANAKKSFIEKTRRHLKISSHFLSQDILTLSFDWSHKYVTSLIHRFPYKSTALVFFFSSGPYANYSNAGKHICLLLACAEAAAAAARGDPPPQTAWGRWSIEVEFGSAKKKDCVKKERRKEEVKVDFHRFSREKYLKYVLFYNLRDLFAIKCERLLNSVQRRRHATTSATSSTCCLLLLDRNRSALGSL